VAFPSMFFSPLRPLASLRRLLRFPPLGGWEALTLQRFRGPLAAGIKTYDSP